MTRISIALLVLIAIAAPASAPAAATPPILVLGDSVAAGVGASSPALAFPAQLGQLRGESVATAGQSGRNLAGVVGQWQQLRAAWPVVVIEVGINDATRYRDGWIGDPGDWALIYRQLIAELRAAGVGRVVVVVPGPIDPRAADYARMVAYADAARGLADVAIIADAWPALIAPGMLVDGVHPCDAGHAAIAQSIADALRWRVFLPALSYTSGGSQ